MGLILIHIYKRGHPQVSHLHVQALRVKKHRVQYQWNSLYHGLSWHNITHSMTMEKLYGNIDQTINSKIDDGHSELKGVVYR